jgi:type IV pilus assembly protein PilQ
MIILPWIVGMMMSAQAAVLEHFKTLQNTDHVNMVFELSEPVHPMVTFKKGELTFVFPNTQVYFNAPNTIHPDLELLTWETGQQNFTASFQTHQTVIPKVIKAGNTINVRLPVIQQGVSVNFQQTPVRSALLALAQAMDVNMLIDPNIQGMVTMRLQQVVPSDLLDIVLESNHLTKKIKGGVLLITTQIASVEQERMMLQQNEMSERMVPLVSRVFRIRYAKAGEIADLIQNPIRSILSLRGKVTVDERANMILVQDTPIQLEMVANLMKQLDCPAEQVLIEARIVTIDKSFEHSLGVRLGFTNPDHVSGTLEGANSMATDAWSTGTGDAAVIPLENRLNVDLPAVSIDLHRPASIGVALAKLGSNVLLDLELSALERDGFGQLIASPRLITENRRAASIEAGTEIPYQEQTSSGATSVSFKKAVLGLKVTPSVVSPEKILLSIQVNQDRVNPTLNVAHVPAIDTHQISTTVLMGNRQTIVLGGIYQENEQHHVQRVPFLGHLPGVGGLFRTSGQTTEQKELLIFITVTIINPS